MAVVFRRSNPHGEIRVVQNRRTGAISYCQGGWYHSRADRAGVSLASYIHALYGLLLQVPGERILVVGGAGGTLASMLSRAGKAVTLVDVDAKAFAVARKFFNLAADVECRVAEGRAFLRHTRARYDAIVMDAYWRGKVPSHLCTVEFFRLVRRRLKPGAAILCNMVVADDRDPSADQIAASMIEAGLSVRILDTVGEAYRNAIVIGGPARRWRRPTLRVRPAILADEIAEELKAMAVRAPRPCNAMLDADETAKPKHRKARSRRVRPATQ